MALKEYITQELKQTRQTRTTRKDRMKGDHCKANKERGVKSKSY